MVVILLGALLTRRGPYGCRRRHVSGQDGDALDALLGTPSAAPAAAPPVAAADTVAELRREIEALRASPAARPAAAPVPPGLAAVVGPDPVDGGAYPLATPDHDVSALRHFVAGTTGQGATTATAHRQQGNARLPAGPPPLPPPQSAPPPAEYAPFNPQRNTGLREQASRLLEVYRWAYGTRHQDPAWQEVIWDAVAEMGRAIDPTLRALVVESGYDTEVERCGVPPAGFGADLAHLSAHGLGTVPAAERQGDLVGRSGAVGNDATLRFDGGLDGELRRAAEEIYKRMRAQGATSARDWLTNQHADAKSDHRWSDLWHSAVTVDFLLGGCASNAEARELLRSSDILELHLRKLAAFVYERRTRDRVGADSMLAITTPGTMADIGPEWLVNTATGYSREEWNRSQRTRWGGPRGRGDGGRGEGGRGSGGGGGAQTPASGSGGANPSGEGGGTARGGRGAATPSQRGGGGGRGGRGGGGRGGPPGRGAA